MTQLLLKSMPDTPEDADAVPRVLTWAVVKRIDPRMPNTWGHWWIELDGEESYGWWPTPCPMGWRGAIFGSRGCLNGIDAGTDGTAKRDAYHGDESDHWFHPTLVVAKTDDQLRADIRAFAHGYAGGFRWQWWWLKGPAQNCRTFQDELFEAVGLYEEAEYLYSRGSGCPFMYPFRRARWRIVDAVTDTRARLRSWPRAHLRQRGDAPGAADPEADLLLTSPRARARARARGTLGPTDEGSTDA